MEEPGGQVGVVRLSSRRLPGGAQGPFMWPGPARWGASASLQASASDCLQPWASSPRPPAVGAPLPWGWSGPQGIMGPGAPEVAAGSPPWREGSGCLCAARCLGCLGGYGPGGLSPGRRRGAVGPFWTLWGSTCSGAQGPTVCRAHLRDLTLPLEEMRVTRLREEHTVCLRNGQLSERPTKIPLCDVAGPQAGLLRPRVRGDARAVPVSDRPRLGRVST